MPPLAVRIPAATCIPPTSSALVSIQTRITFLPVVKEDDDRGGKEEDNRRQRGRAEDNKKQEGERGRQQNTEGESRQEAVGLGMGSEFFHQQNYPQRHGLDEGS